MATFSEENEGFPLPLYQPVSGPSFTLGSAVFDAAHKEITFKEGAPISTLRPVLGVRLSLFPMGVAPQQGDRVTLRSILYKVADVQPDGHGHALLILKRAE
jgi:hypothetical protein